MTLLTLHRFIGLNPCSLYMQINSKHYCIAWRYIYCDKMFGKKSEQISEKGNKNRVCHVLQIQVTYTCGICSYCPFLSYICPATYIF